MIKKRTYESLGFNMILDKLANHALSNSAKEKALKLEPYIDEKVLRNKISETTEAVNYVNNIGIAPLVIMDELENILIQVKSQNFLSPEKLNRVKSFIYSTIRMKKYLLKSNKKENILIPYARTIKETKELADEIDRKIKGEYVDDSASCALTNIRRKISFLDEKIKDKLKSLIRNNKKYFQEEFMALRNGRYTLLVASKYKNYVKGSVIDKSNTGGTYFIEPDSVKKYQSEFEFLKIEEDAEKRRILYEISNHVLDNINELRMNIEIMQILDFIFAKAKLSLEFDCVEPCITTNREISLNEARHPSISKKEVVPIDFRLGFKEKAGSEDIIRRVIITGPNTGGKTVALKTVGLLTLMAQSGLHIPVKSATICMNNVVLADIGDNQSIYENLSTFSSHMANIIQILKIADEQSLILLDELGSGTDPSEGMGMALVILNEIAKLNSFLVASTHYLEIKEYAKKTKGFINARMAFDRENLKPLYKLEIGMSGESCAFHIAKKIGFPDEMIAQAKKAKMNQNFETNNDRYIKKDKSKTCRIIKTEKEDNTIKKVKEKFEIGDSVIIYPQKETGIIYKKTDEKGITGVLIKDKKKLINHKRIKLRISKNHLYPEDYDFSIIFDSVENRKARKKMSKRHIPGLEIKIDDELK